MAAGQQGQAESLRPPARAASVRRGWSSDGASRSTAPGGPAFISDQAEELHYLETLHDHATDGIAKAVTRLDLARLYERRGQFAEAVEMYERNVWDGARTPATYAGLAAAYRELGRHDLADAALEQIRRQGGADRAAGSRTDDSTTATAIRPRSPRGVSRPSGAVRVPTAGRRAESTARIARQRPTRPPVADAGERTGAALDQLQRAVAPFLAGEAGRRTLVVSTVLLPIVLGLGIFIAVVVSSARPRVAEPVAAATPAPVATVMPTAAPTAPPTLAVPAALVQPPAPARLVVNNVGPDGLSLRRAPGATSQRIKVWKDGTELADLGETSQDGGMTWRKVRDPDGNVGWTAADYLADPASRAAAAPAAPAFGSGGLGLARAEWEKAHGKPTQSSIFLEYDSGRLVVGLLEGNVWHIERVWMRGEAATIDAAREDARAYLPVDATLSQSIDRGDGRVVDVYSSASLARRFGPTAWNGGQVGTFTIQYRFRTPADRMVTSAMFRLGDVPS